MYINFEYNGMKRIAHEQDTKMNKKMSLKCYQQLQLPGTTVAGTHVTIVI